MGDCLIPAVANYRQMRQLGFQLRHRVAHDEPRPTLPSISRSFIASPKAMHSCRVKPKCWLSTASAAPLLQPTGSTSRQSIAEKQKCAIAQRLIQLDPQTAQIVMIAAETDLGDMLRRHALQIAQLIVKAAEYMRLQQFRPCTAGEPAAIVKDVHAGWVSHLPCSTASAASGARSRR